MHTYRPSENVAHFILHRKNTIKCSFENIWRKNKFKSYKKWIQTIGTFRPVTLILDIISESPFYTSLQ